MSSFKLTGLAAGSTAGDSVRYEQVLLLAGGTMTGAINMGSQKITVLGTGTTATDAVNYGQTAPGILTTAGDVMYASAANTPARLAVGTTGQVFVVNSSGTAPQWGSITRGADAGWTLISTSGAVTGQASIAFTTGISSTYDAYAVTLTNIVPSTDTANLTFLASISAGAAYLGAYNYGGYYTLETGATAATTGVGAGVIVLGVTLGNATGETYNGVFYLMGPASSSATFKSFHGTFVMRREDSNTVSGYVGGTITTGTAVNAFKVQAGSGNLSGTVSLYGLRKS